MMYYCPDSGVPRYFSRVGILRHLKAYSLLKDSPIMKSRVSSTQDLDTYPHPGSGLTRYYFSRLWRNEVAHKKAERLKMLKRLGSAALEDSGEDD
jgi:hypothetical protein